MNLEQLPARFRSKVVVDENGCWLWCAYVQPNGYGQYGVGVYPNGGMVAAHRHSYLLLVGPIPDGLQLDHLCRVTRCVNPAHLEPVTARENTLRSDGLCAINARKTHCIHGHPLSGDNLLVAAYRRERICRLCATERSRRSRDRKRKAAL